jgi:hypothetical protein
VKALQAVVQTIGASANSGKWPKLKRTSFFPIYRAIGIAEFINKLFCKTVAHLWSASIISLDLRNFKLKQSVFLSCVSCISWFQQHAMNKRALVKKLVAKLTSELEVYFRAAPSGARLGVTCQPMRELA